jgi:hypothetical protein
MTPWSGVPQVAQGDEGAAELLGPTRRASDKEVIPPRLLTAQLSPTSPRLNDRAWTRAEWWVIVKKSRHWDARR